jgi:hypothetical protein
MSDIKLLKEKYRVPIEKWGKYLSVVRKGKDIAVMFEVGNQGFEIGMRMENTKEHRTLAEFTRIMFCQALNVMVIKEQEGIDTSDIPEMDFKGAKVVVGKFHRPGQPMQITEPMREEIEALGRSQGKWWPFP